MRNIFTFSVLAVLLLGSFTRHTDRSIDANNWYLTAIYHTDGFTQVMMKKAFIHFDMEKGNAGGNAACNSFGAAITVEGDKISFKNIFSTKMFCADMQSIENDMLRQLRKVTRYEIKGDCLLLFAGEVLLLEFASE